MVDRRGFLWTLLAAPFVGRVAVSAAPTRVSALALVRDVEAGIVRVFPLRPNVEGTYRHIYRREPRSMEWFRENYPIPDLSYERSEGA